MRHIAQRFKRRYNLAGEIETALYTVATPIGNLGDITFRALDVLKNVDVIACEDTRITSRLCEKYDIKTRLISYHKFSENKRTELFLGYLKEGKSVALVSDAGTPLVSDPGEILVKSVVEAGFRVIPICGASAVIALLQSVQRMGENFKFVGFLPRVKGQIEEIFLKNKAENLVFYQSPNRMEETLKILAKLRPQAVLSYGRELTKKFEEIKTAPVKEVLENLTQKGEFVCMVHCEINDDIEAQIIEKASTLKSLRLCDKDIINVLCAFFDFPKNKVKEILYKL